MDFDFDHVVNRRHTNSIKWDFPIPGCRHEDPLPMWVADMDFPAPPMVREAIQSVAQHGIYGYTGPPPSYFEAITNWCRLRYGYSPDESAILYTPGVITGLNIAIQTFTEPGDEIVLQPPVYPPFFASVRNNNRRIINNRLIADGRSYSMDLDHLRSAITPRTRMLVLCSPHNPVGRVWSEAELRALGEICLEHDLFVFADEIHADLVYPEARHVTFASLSPELAARTITGIAPSKSFNIAGLKASVIIAENPRLKAELDRAHQRIFGLYNANTFAVTALEAAYRHGAPWLDALLSYLDGNRRRVAAFIADQLQGVSTTLPEGTFLMWLDFRALRLSQAQLCDVLYNTAGVLLNSGADFGPGGEGFMRLNIGCPQALLMEGLKRLEHGLTPG